MKVAQALIFAVMAFQANAFLDHQETNQEVTEIGGAGGKGGDNKQDGGNGGDGPKSVSSVLTDNHFLALRPLLSWLPGQGLQSTTFPCLF